MIEGGAVKFARMKNEESKLITGASCSDDANVSITIKVSLLSIKLHATP